MLRNNSFVFFLEKRKKNLVSQLNCYAAIKIFIKCEFVVYSLFEFKEKNQVAFLLFCKNFLCLIVIKPLVPRFC